MKFKKLKIVSFFSIFVFISMSALCANEADFFSEENTELEDIDSLFENSEDTHEAQTASKVESPNKTDDFRQGISLNGHLSTLVGGYAWLNPWDVTPAAIFESVLAFSSKPTDTFSTRGSILVSFPKMQIDLYELYFNYTLWNFAFVMVGKKQISWGNARIFDTNILDDKNNYVYNPMDLLTYEPIDAEKSKFTVSLNVPLGFFNVTGLIFYSNYLPDSVKNKWDISNVSISDLSYAASLEFNVSNFSFDIFTRQWAKNDPNKFDPAIGTNINFQIRDLHLYAQYVTHFKKDSVSNQIIFPRMKGTVSAWWYTRDKINLAFCVEYQLVADWYKFSQTLEQRVPADYSEYIKQYIALEAGWGRIFDTPITIALKYFHDVYENYGTIIPGVKFHDLLPNTEIDFGIPIYYGSQHQVGLAIQLKLNVDF